MFTGLVQGCGEVTALTIGEESMVLTFSAHDLATQVGIGDSICVNGVCLTAIKIISNEISVDVMLQTLNLTNLKDLAVGDSLNLELALRATDRMGGHIVQGHIDGVGTALLRQVSENWERLDVRVPEELLKYIVAQGSVAINGVSLTVGAIDDESHSITLWLIPETLAKTNLGKIAVGNLLNIEVDVLGKYVERLLERKTSA